MIPAVIHSIRSRYYLAAVPSSLVDGAVLVGQADVLGVLLDGPLEEALAALAGPHPVVLAGRVVPAHCAQQARPTLAKQIQCSFYLASNHMLK